jgi:hypothetical protein
MRFVSTRGDTSVSLDAALVNGIAHDGGLYVPVELPMFNVTDFGTATTISEIAAILLRPFFSDSSLIGELEQILVSRFQPRHCRRVMATPACSSFIMDRLPRLRMLVPVSWRRASVVLKETRRRR